MDYNVRVHESNVIFKQHLCKLGQLRRSNGRNSQVLGQAMKKRPSLQRCCWKMMLLSFHPNIIVHVENVVSLLSSPSTSSQKVRKCGGHKFISNTCELLLRSFPSLQRCYWKMMLLSLHPNIIVHVENVVSLFSSPSTSSQKVRKCGGHKFISQAI